MGVSGGIPIHSVFSEEAVSIVTVLHVSSFMAKWKGRCMAVPMSGQVYEAIC